MIKIEDFGKVRNCLCDDISKKVFDNKIMFNYTGDYRYIYDILEKSYPKEIGRKNDIVGLINRYNKGDIDNKIIIFGAGEFGSTVFNYLSSFDIKVDGIIDNNPIIQGQRRHGMIVEKPIEVIMSNISAVYMLAGISTKVINSMKNELISLGVFADNIYVAYSPYGIQYFDSLVPITEDEIFVDAGAFDCMTALDFCKVVDNKYKKIYSFEPEEGNYLVCIENAKKNGVNNIEILNNAVWDKAELLKFESAANGSLIDELGSSEIKAISIDEVLQGERASFIKMDVEGAEYKALIGAKNTISMYKPKLAICIYHKPEDMVEIPMLIKEMNPKYRLYVRHYSNVMWETVLYAI